MTRLTALPAAAALAAALTVGASPDPTIPARQIVQVDTTHITPALTVAVHEAAHNRLEAIR